MASLESVSPFYKIIWIAYLLIAPVYIFQSGYPQPADMILVFGLIPALGLAFLKVNMRVPAAVLVGLGFVTLTFSINIIHYVFTPDRKFLLSSLYYVYNFGVFLFVTHLFSSAPQRINRLTYLALAGSILVELGFVMFAHGDTIRAQGSFNNPNQLGYWSLLSFVLLIVVKREERLTVWDVGLILAVFATQLLSLSKAGILSMAFCMMILFFSRLISNNQRVLILVLVLVGSVYVAFVDGGLSRKLQELDVLQAVYTRISTIGTQGDDSLGGRGYDRIVANPHYLILGAGEGANWRYSEKAKELHSGLATLLFSYGVVGFLMFFCFLYCVFKGLPWRHILLLIPIMMYGATHQNIRFTYFWVVIAAAYSGRYFERSVREVEGVSFAYDSNIGETPPGQHAT